MLFSPMAPINEGQIAPPTIVITRIDDAALVLFPNPRIPSANIDGNIIDMKR